MGGSERTIEAPANGAANPEDAKTAADNQKAVDAGQSTLTDAQEAAKKAIEAAKAAPGDEALAEQAAMAQQISAAIQSLVTAPKEMTDEELIALAERERRMRAGLGVVAAITGALYALHTVL